MAWCIAHPSISNDSFSHLQAQLGRHDAIPAFIGRSGSVPDNFGSGSPAAWCVTSGDRSSPLHGDQDSALSPLTYAASDAQARPGGSIASMLGMVCRQLSIGAVYAAR